MDNEMETIILGLGISPIMENALEKNMDNLLKV